MLLFCICSLSRDRGVGLQARCLISDVVVLHLQPVQGQGVGLQARCLISDVVVLYLQPVQGQGVGLQARCLISDVVVLHLQPVQGQGVGLQARCRPVLAVPTRRYVPQVLLPPQTQVCR